MLDKICKIKNVGGKIYNENKDKNVI